MNVIQKKNNQYKEDRLWMKLIRKQTVNTIYLLNKNFIYNINLNKKYKSINHNKKYNFNLMRMNREKV